MYIWEARPTIEDFHAVEWQSIIDNSEKKTYRDYDNLLQKHLETTTEGSKEERVFAFLRYICAIILRADSSDTSLVGLTIQNGAIVLETPQKDLLLAILSEIKDAELRARVADLLWVSKHGKYDTVITAIKSYLESAILLEDPKHWVDSEKRIRRALHLALGLGRNNSALPLVLKHIETTLDKYQGQDPLFLSARLMEQLLYAREGDPAKYAALAEKAAAFVSSNPQPVDWHRSRTHWEIAASWYHRLGNEENNRKALMNAAETFVKEAESYPEDYPQRSAIVAKDIERAIVAYRKIPETDTRRNELHKLLLSYQQKSVSGFGTATTEVDLTSISLQAVDAVKGKSFYEALVALARLESSPSKQWLRELVEKQIETSGLIYAISAFKVDPDGKTTGRRPGLSQGDRETIIRDEMLREATLRQDLIFGGIIWPAIHQIRSEHYFEERDFFQIVENNPFVPPNRASIYARGLCAGLRGDMLVAIHLLVPQVENSIRHVLQNCGVITSGLDNEHIQDEYSLQRILYGTYAQELEKIIGEDLLFDLQGLLIERFGSNLRNLVAHGLLDEQIFSSRRTVYLWWLVLRLCCSLVYVRPQREDASTTLV